MARPAIETILPQRNLNRLTAISPLDGRYWDQVKELSPFASEMGLIQARVEVEARYLVALSDNNIIRSFQPEERQFLMDLGPTLSEEQVQQVKDIETTTRHDVKAMERAFRGFLEGTSLADVTEMIHFGLTSEDVNNLAQRLMLSRARDVVLVPALDQVVDDFAQKASQFKDIPLLARTHGQPAIPTTLGKEMANIAVRLNAQVRELQMFQLTGKLTGAVGNLNAHKLAIPHIDWIAFSESFVESLGLEPNFYTTQINPYEDMITLFQTLQRINGIIRDTDQNMWRYISDDWFTQKPKEGEVGSSTMPQKVNPIDFENSEGNTEIANGVWDVMVRELPVSRLQRDLSDSTVIRNIGVGLAHGLLAYKNIHVGLGKIFPNLELISAKLNDNWNILSEGVQTVLRKAGVEDPYSLIASLSKGKKIGPQEWNTWIDALPIALEYQNQLKALTPEAYIGYAQRLTDRALAEIADSRGETLPQIITP